MSRKDSISIDPVLTELARGEKSQMLYFDKLFPIVSVKKEHGKIPAYLPVLNKKYKTERALRAGSNVRNPADVEKIDYLCNEHDISATIDKRELEESDLPLERREMFNNQKIIEYGIEREAAALATDAANFDPANVEVLSGTDLFDDPASKPLLTLSNAINALQLQLGADYDLNMVISKPVWDVLKEHPTIVGKIQYSMKGIVTEDILKEIIGLKGSITVADSVDDGNYIWGKNIILGIVPKMIDSVYTPSFGYTFRKKGYPYVDTFTENGGKLKNIRYTDCYDIKIMSGQNGFLLSNCIS